MENLPNGFTLEIPAGAFPLSTDSMVLGDFVRLPKKARVADLCSGCGTLGLLLCARDAGCTVTGFELDEVSHRGALSNIERNGLSSRMTSIAGDLRETTQSLPQGSFDICISNPPYFSGGPASALGSLRKDDMCSTLELMQCAGRLLKFGGDFFLVHKPEKLADIIARGAGFGLEAKELLLLRHREKAPVALVLLKLRKGAAPGLTIRELCLTDANGEFTPDYRRIYHMD